MFARQGSAPLLGLTLVAAVILRVLLGHFDWRDPIVLAGLMACTPAVEWLIHVYVLHARPLEMLGRRVDLLAAREHRAHHRSPSVLSGVLIPAYALPIFFAQIALTVWLVSFPIHWIFGGDRLAHAATALLGALAILAAYEWSHFLIHTPYRPRGRYYRAIWRGHRLHHFKNERYWFGVTSTVADRLLGTAPDQAAVAKSGTALTLGADGVGEPVAPSS
jgi:sterol desaturase/sphingolipid hydroxylase (fatty acid hydroxylase superfamily)